MEFILTKCMISKQPMERGVQLSTSSMDQHTENLRLHISTSASSAVISVIGGKGSLMRRQVERLGSTATSGTVAICVCRDTKILLKSPSSGAPSLDDVCQFNFPDASMAHIAANLLRPYYAIDPKSTVNMSTLPTQQPGQIPLGHHPIHTSALHSSPQSHLSLPAPRAQHGLPSSAEAIPATTREIGATTGDKQGETPESEVFIETQFSLNAVESQTHSIQQTKASSGSSVSVTEENESDSPRGKKRKFDANANSTEKPIPDEKSTEHSPGIVSNLIDLDDHKEESSDSLRVDYPALNPHEGKPWGVLNRLSPEPNRFGIVERPNRFITAGVYGMSDNELEATIDEIVTEVGFQQMCARVAHLLDNRRGGQAAYQVEVDEGFYTNPVVEDESW